MFSTGQLVFTVFFIVCFAIVLVWSYRKDIRLHKVYYNKVWLVALGIVAVIALFAAITFWLH